MAVQREGYQRVLRLVAFADEHAANGFTRSDVAANVPGFADLSDSALDKALQRDRAVLAESLGIVIDWSEETQRYSLRPPLLSAKERHALITAAAFVNVNGIGEDLPPGEIGAAVEAAVAQVAVWVQPLVVAIRDAIVARQPISFRYQGVEGDPATRVIDPYAVGLWRNHWYVVGFDPLRDDQRVFRLDRIQSQPDEPAIAVVGEPDAFEVPDDVDLASALVMDPNNWGSDPPLTAEVRVLRDVVPRFLDEFAGTITVDDESSARFRIEVRHHESFVIRLLGFGKGVRLLGPPELTSLLQRWLTGQVGA